MTGKGKVPPVGVEPNVSQLLHKHPRLLDHRDFPVLSWSLIQVILKCPLLWLSIFTKHHLHIPSVQMCYNCISLLHICQMAHHHLNIWFLRMFTKWNFSMFLIISQLDNVNTTLRLHYYDNRHIDKWIDDWSMNRSHNEQLTMQNRH